MDIEQDRDPEFEGDREPAFVDDAGDPATKGWLREALGGTGVADPRESAASTKLKDRLSSTPIFAAGDIDGATQWLIEKRNDESGEADFLGYAPLKVSLHLFIKKFLPSMPAPGEAAAQFYFVPLDKTGAKLGNPGKPYTVNVAWDNSILREIRAAAPAGAYGTNDPMLAMLKEQLDRERAEREAAEKRREAAEERARLEHEKALTERLQHANSVQSEIASAYTRVGQVQTEGFTHLMSSQERAAMEREKREEDRLRRERDAEEARRKREQDELEEARKRREEERKEERDRIRTENQAQIDRVKEEARLRTQEMEAQAKARQAEIESRAAVEAKKIEADVEKAKAAAETERLRLQAERDKEEQRRADERAREDARRKEEADREERRRKDDLDREDRRKEAEERYRKEMEAREEQRRRDEQAREERRQQAEEQVRRDALAREDQRRKDEQDREERRRQWEEQLRKDELARKEKLEAEERDRAREHQRQLETMRTEMLKADQERQERERTRDKEHLALTISLLEKRFASESGKSDNKFGVIGEILDGLGMTPTDALAKAKEIMEGGGAAGLGVTIVSEISKTVREVIKRLPQAEDEEDEEDEEEEDEETEEGEEDAEEPKKIEQKMDSPQLEDFLTKRTPEPVPVTPAAPAAPLAEMKAGRSAISGMVDRLAGAPEEKWGELIMSGNDVDALVKHIGRVGLVKALEGHEIDAAKVGEALVKLGLFEKAPMEPVQEVK